MALSDWMSKYQDRTLGKMHLPGSHDAGTAKKYIDKTTFGTDSNAATQNLTIREQLDAGTRFFDLRLAEHNKQVVAHHTTAGQGAYSKKSVDQVLAAADQWCAAHKTEVAIFRISHTKARTNVHDIIKASCVTSLHTGSGNLCKKTLGEIVSQGGGLICILDEKEFGPYINQREGIHSFTKYSSNPANDRGISTCGCYSGTHAIKNVVRNGLKGQFDHNKNHASREHGHLWQLYWQKTYVNPASMQGIEDGTKKAMSVDKKGIHGGTHATIGYMIDKMQGHSPHNLDFTVKKEVSHREGLRRKKVVDEEAIMYSSLDVRNYTLPNIISYDFVNGVTNQTIIDLNNKGLQGIMEDNIGARRRANTF